MATATQTPATDKQKSFLLRLAHDRRAGNSTPQQRVEVMQSMIEAGISKRRATEMISQLTKAPFDNAAKSAPSSPAVKQVHPDLTPGVYDVDGQVFVVKFTQDKKRLYAKRLVVINGDRLNVNGDLMQIEFEYDAGAVFKVQPSQKMPLAEAKELTLRYGRCIVCGRRLKAGKSVEQGIGPVCLKSFA